MSWVGGWKRKGGKGREGKVREGKGDGERWYLPCDSHCGGGLRLGADGGPRVNLGCC